MTLLIKSVQVLGAGRELPERADVFISGDKISAIGSFPNKGADETLDGQGCYLAPGFIDVHAESDHSLDLFTHPSQEEFLNQGVTTIICGQDGISLAPLLYGELDAIPRWAETPRVNVNWHTMDEFLGHFNRRPLGVNVATLAGHGTIRRALAGEKARPLTRNELRVFEHVLTRSLAEGGFGFSVDSHAAYATQKELAALSLCAGRRCGVYAEHIRHANGDFLERIHDAIAVVNETEGKTILDSIPPVAEIGGRYEEALHEIERYAERFSLRFSLPPHAVSILPLHRFLPEWAQHGTLIEMSRNLRDEWLKKRIKEDLPTVAANNFIVARAPRHEVFVGQTLTDIMGHYETKNTEDALLTLMTTTSLRALVFYKNIDEATLRRALAHPQSFVGSHETGTSAARRAGIPAAFPHFLSLVQSYNLLPLDRAVRKITKEPAEFFDLKERGEVREGYLADLVGFSMTAVPPGEGKRTAANGKKIEIKFTVVNGRVAVKDGVFQNVHAGKALKHRS